jgi:hypothetical protein
MMLRALLCLLACVAACVGDIGERPLPAVPFDAQLIESPIALSTASGFADERGGGIFADTDGHAVRLRVDGSKGALESHPGNSQAPDKVLRVFPAGPFNALVAAENGLYVAESGWLIEPGWRDAIDAHGVVTAALGGDGVAWIAHEQGLFHIDGGELSELKLQGKSIEGISALAVAPAADGANALWFAQGAKLSFAKQTGRASYEVADGGLSAQSLGGSIVALAGVSASPQSLGELWLITSQGLFQHTANGWGTLETPDAPKALLSAGRFVWLLAGKQLYRYDADARRWGRANGLSTLSTMLTLLAADASGGAWVQAGDQTLSVSSGAVPRIFGLFEGARLYQPDVQVHTQIPVTSDPSAVSFTIDDGPRVEQKVAAAQPGTGAIATLDFALGGFDAAGHEQSYSMAGLSSGLHTLTVTAELASGPESRRLHFDFRSSTSSALSFAKDVKPIFEARCAKCHSHGPGHELKTYEEWVSDKDRMVKAVVELRMPADGPLDPTQIQILQRWASGGSAP